MNVITGVKKKENKILLAWNWVIYWDALKYRIYTDNNYYYFSVADPGFPRGGGANSPGGGAPTYDFAKISWNLHEIERISMPGGGRRGGGWASLAPPKTANAFNKLKGYL